MVQFHNLFIFINIVALKVKIKKMLQKLEQPVWYFVWSLLAFIIAYMCSFIDLTSLYVSPVGIEFQISNNFAIKIKEFIYGVILSFLIYFYCSVLPPASS